LNSDGERHSNHIRNKDASGFNLFILFTVASVEKGQEPGAFWERLNLNAGDHLRKIWKRILLGILGIFILLMIIGAISFYSL
jgi:hypothetical protein